jgi:AcrR family transcriptional regulator
MNRNPASPTSRRDDGKAVSPTRARVLRVAAGLFAERGFSAVGVNEIGEATGLGRGALYYHIASKEDLLYDITTAYMSDLVSEGVEIAAATPDAAERIRALSRALMMTVSDHLAEMTVCFRELHALSADRRRSVTVLHADYQAIWGAALADGVAQNKFRPVSSVVLKGLLGMYFYSFLWLDPRGPENAAAIGDSFAEVVLKTVMEEHAGSDTAAA